MHSIYIAIVLCIFTIIVRIIVLEHIYLHYLYCHLPSVCFSASISALYIIF